MPKLGISLPDDVHYTLVYYAKTRRRTVSGVIAKSLRVYFEEKQVPIHSDRSMQACSHCRRPPSEPEKPHGFSSGNDSFPNALVERLTQLEEKLYAIQLSTVQEKRDKALTSSLAELTQEYYDVQQESMALLRNHCQPIIGVPDESLEIQKNTNEEK